MPRTSLGQRTLLLAVWSLALAACQTPGQPTALAARLAAQNALFADEYELDLQMHPELATENGDFRYNDRLNDRSIAGAERLHRADQQFLARLKAISTAGFSEQDALSHQLMQSLLE